MRLGVFGGTFNPIHYGHLRAAEEAREILGLARVLFVPSGNPPLKDRDLADASCRLEMTRRAAAGNPFSEVLDIECASREKSYTVTTLEALRVLHPSAELYFLLGIDAFLDLPRWWRPDDLIGLTNFCVLARPGRRFADLAQSPYITGDKGLLLTMDEPGPDSLRIALRSSREAVLIRNISFAVTSTDIRRRIREGRSIKYLLPEDVESFIISERLYGAAS